MNKVILKGRTTKAPEIKYSSDGKEITCYARFTLAVEDRTYKEAEDKFHVDFIPVFVVGKLAELIERTVSKGQELLLEGKWRTSSYVNKDGKTIYTQSLFLEQLEYCGKKSDTSIDDGFMNIPDGFDEELPFK